jgi:ABC-type transport system involved in multi-copper enzyme maturation permease subunit
MNFLEIVRFEIDYRLRRPYTWILGAVFVGVACLMAMRVLVSEAEGAGDLHANAPSLVGMATVLVSMLGLVISAALFSEAALRDHETRMFSLFATSPLTKTQYLAGRFAGTLLVNVLFVSIVPIMLMLIVALQRRGPKPGLAAPVLVTVWWLLAASAAHIASPMWLVGVGVNVLLLYFALSIWLHRKTRAYLEHG